MAIRFRARRTAQPRARVMQGSEEPREDLGRLDPGDRRTIGRLTLDPAHDEATLEPKRWPHDWQGSSTDRER